MSETIRIAAQEVKRQLEERVGALTVLPQMAEIIQLAQALNALEGVLGEPKTSLATLFGLEAGPVSDGQPGLIAVRFDEFYGLPALQAAKKYLKKCPDARAFEEIVAAIKRGGGKVDSEDDLRMGLTRSTLDIVKIADRYGAIEKYPDVKRGGKKRASLKPSEAEPDDAGDEADEPEGDATSE